VSPCVVDSARIVPGAEEASDEELGGGVMEEGVLLGGSEVRVDSAMVEPIVCAAKSPLPWRPPVLSIGMVAGPTSLVVPLPAVPAIPPPPSTWPSPTCLFTFSIDSCASSLDESELSSLISFP